MGSSVNVYKFGYGANLNLYVNLCSVQHWQYVSCGWTNIVENDTENSREPQCSRELRNLAGLNEPRETIVFAAPLYFCLVQFLCAKNDIH